MYDDDDDEDVQDKCCLFALCGMGNFPEQVWKV